MYEQQLQEVWVLSMKRILTALTVAATMFASSASAADPADLRKLKDTNECVACNLNGVYLNGAILCNTTMPDSSVIYSGC